MLAKIFESIAGRHLLVFLEPSLDDSQFGSRKGRSTTHAIVTLLHNWMASLDSGGSVRAVFIDFRKAFDLVNHNILFSKLKKYDIPHFLLAWLGSYLSNRQQSVRVNQCLSSWLPLMGGMPQGSWLGPLSFLVLIDDLTAGCPTVKYDDDTTLSETFQPKSYNSSMAVFLDNLLALSLENNMELNTSKTKEMVLGTIARPGLAPALLTTPFGTVERVNSFKLLGVHIESSLCWSTHINSILKKGTRRMHFLGRNEYLISTLSESAFP